MALGAYFLGWPNILENKYVPKIDHSVQVGQLIMYYTPNKLALLQCHFIVYHSYHLTPFQNVLVLPTFVQAISRKHAGNFHIPIPKHMNI